ncbi:hypothetical protein [Campylobacter concisus]|uniref:Uncharacterized protein n=1 Tax=Campylobacter concisus TaxID=199 RepID=A0A7S9SB60_9BACT|nr:hypothetical protein [Campylobacter concisus]MBE9836283.1 hypothetical protein [Campylobacter concisus]MBE9856692.1 hypothetical protein [Campylobacter concisus]QPI06992.1 hypothetical protein G5B96_06550 [Campylobacter concisus]
MDINDLYSSLVFAPIVLAILLMIFAGRRNIKVYVSKFDLVGLHLIFPLVIFPTFVAIFCEVCEYFDVSNDDGLTYIFYTILFIIAIYAIFGFYVCIKYNHGFLNCFWALLLRFNFMTTLVYSLFLGGKGRDKNGNEITPENAKNLSLFGKLRFSLYNMIVFRKNYDKDKVAGRDEEKSSDKVLISKEEWDEFLKWENSRES